MHLKSTIAAVAALLVSTASLADTNTLMDTNGGAYSFSLGSLNLTSASNVAISFEFLSGGLLGFMLPSDNTLTLTSATTTLSGQATATGGTATGPFGSTATTYSYTFNNVSIGNYNLTLSGTSGGQYTGVNVSAPSISGGTTATAVTAVPEPETYAMMLAGLVGLGFLGRRRKAA